MKNVNDMFYEQGLAPLVRPYAAQHTVSMMLTFTGSLEVRKDIEPKDKIAYDALWADGEEPVSNATVIKEDPVC